MSPALIKWTLFTALLLSAPALLFLVAAVMFLPAIFFVVGIFVIVPKLFMPAQAGESLWFLLFLGIHLVVYGGLYYLLALLLAKAISLIGSNRGRLAATAVVLTGLVGLTFLPVYGAGGHGPINWKPLADLLTEINRDYGRYTVALTYGATALVFATGLAVRHRRRAGARD